MSEKIKIGMIVNTQGLKGELRVKLISGYKENFERFEFFYIEGQKYAIEKYRFKKNLLIIKFESIDDIDTAEQFINSSIYLNKEEVPLLDNEFLIEDLVGSDVYVYRRGLIGQLVKIDNEISSTGIFVIENPENNQEYMIPIISQFIKKIDFKNKKILLENVEGLVE